MGAMSREQWEAVASGKVIAGRDAEGNLTTDEEAVMVVPRDAQGAPESIFTEASEGRPASRRDAEPRPLTEEEKNEIREKNRRKEHYGAPRKETAKVVKSATIWDQQCFLVENMKRLTKVGAGRQYENFGKLEGNPGSIVSTLHRGPLDDRSVDIMLDLSPSQYSFLVPHMKLTRVLYKKGDPLTVIGEDEIPIESFTSRQNIEDILTNQEARQAGAGLKSFTWKLDGVQPEEVDNNITATLEMHFQSIHELFRRGLDPGKEASEATAGRIEHPSFLDLIIAPESTVFEGEGPPPDPNSAKHCSLDKKQALTYDGALYRIKIDVGWAIPAGMENHPDIAGNAADFEEALRKQRKTLYLQLARHNISFQQDGVVKLTVEYQAALNGIFRSQWSNIFAGPEQLKDIFKEDERAKMLREDHRAGRITEEEKKQLEVYLDQQIALEQEDRLIKYRRVLKHIYDSDKISSIRIPMIELLRSSYKELTPMERAARAKRRQSASSTTRGFSVNASGVNTGPGPHELLENMENKDVLDKKEIERMGKGLNSVRRATPRDKVDIHYFYLGDLIDSILTLPQIKKQLEKRNWQLVLGTVEYIDPLVGYQIENLKDIVNCGGLRKAQTAAVIAAINPMVREPGSQIIEHISMSAIPISVDAFNEWFYNRVIKKNLTKYYLDQFIRDLLGALVGRALSSRCFPGIPQVPLRFATNDFFIAGDSVNGQGLRLDELRKRVRRHMKPFPKNWEHFHPAVRSMARSLGRAPPIPTLFVYSTDSLPAGSMGHNQQEDHNIGIYHFYLGASAGLVKKIEYQRDDMPYFREAKIHKQGALGATQLRELYKVKMTIIGNTLLKNGQYIYVNPTAIGAGSGGSKHNIAKMLGLGGYFLVTSVSHRVSASGFEVTVEALHQAVPEHPEKSVPIKQWFVDMEKPPRAPRRRPKKFHLEVPEEPIISQAAEAQLAMRFGTRIIVDPEASLLDRVIAEFQFPGTASPNLVTQIQKRLDPSTRKGDRISKRTFAHLEVSAEADMIINTRLDF